MIDIYTEIRKVIEVATKAASIEVSEIHIEHPADISHGDFSTNIALTKSKELGKNPREIAETIVAEIEKQNSEYIETVEIAGPGFINIKLSAAYLSSVAGEVIKAGESFGSNEIHKGKKKLFEYTDPNPLKVFHIGHFMSNAVGEANSRIADFNGAEVKRAVYFGDTGVHIAKTMYALRSIKDEIEKDAPLRDQVAFLGKAYATGNNLYEDDLEVKTEIDALNKSIYLKEDSEDYELYKWAREVSLDYFETIYQKLGTKFDFYFPESEAGPVGKELVEKKLLEDVFEESDGAIIFPGEKHDSKLHTRVFINKHGVPTYEGKELALAGIKHNEYPYDISVVVTADEIREYFKVLKKAMSFVYPDLEKKTIHLSHGMLKLPDGKMSSRKGTVISAEDLIGEVQKDVLDKMADRDIPEEEKQLVSEKIAIGALKYQILKQDSSKDVIYDAQKAVSFEGDSGPYVQYAYVRSQALIKKAQEAGVEYSTEVAKVYGLENILYRFSDVVQRAGEEHAPQYITTYMTELASEFNSFYAKEKVADPSDPNAGYKLSLVKAVGQTLKNAMNLLAIPVVERM